MPIVLPQPRDPVDPPAAAVPALLPDRAGDPLASWVSAVRLAAEPCVVLDRHGVVAAAAPAFADVLGLAPDQLTGRDLVDEVLDLLDFGPEAGPADRYADRIPPVLSLSAGVLTRGLLRARTRDGARVTLDAVATPLHDGTGTVVGSLTFFACV